mgnify:CR=1 FL=1
MKNHSKISYAKYGYYFVLPFFIAWLIFSLYPTLYTAIIGFTDLKGVNAKGWHFLTAKDGGIFNNYKIILTNPTFLTAFKNTFKIWICNFIPQIGLALFLAAIFTNTRMKIPCVGLFKVLFYMPNIITASTVAILFAALFGYPMGPVNDLLQTLKIIDEPVNFLVKKTVARNIVIFIQTWMWYGYTMINMISGILGISPDIFEAADIDGANGWQVFWKITVPSIKTILLFTLVTSLIGGLTMFDIPQLFINNGGPDNATITTSVFIYGQAFKGSYMYNRASAASMIMFVIIILLSAVIFFALRDKDEVALRKQLKAQKKAQKLALKASAKGVANV